MMDEKVCGSLPQAAKNPQVSQELEKLSHALGSLEELTVNLTSNLNNVLRQPNPPSDKKDSVESEIVPLAHEIRVSHGRVHRVCESVRDLLDRLEV